MLLWLAASLSKLRRGCGTPFHWRSTRLSHWQLSTARWRWTLSAGFLTCVAVLIGNAVNGYLIFCILLQFMLCMLFYYFTVSCFGVTLWFENSRVLNMTDRYMPFLKCDGYLRSNRPLQYYLTESTVVCTAPMHLVGLVRMNFWMLHMRTKNQNKVSSAAWNLAMFNQKTIWQTNILCFLPWTVL